MKACTLHHNKDPFAIEHELLKSGDLARVVSLRSVAGEIVSQVLSIHSQQVLVRSEKP